MHTLQDLQKSPSFFMRVIYRLQRLVLHIIGLEGTLLIVATYALFHGNINGAIWLGTVTLAAGSKTYQAKNGISDVANILPKAL